MLEKYICTIPVVGWMCKGWVHMMFVNVANQRWKLQPTGSVHWNTCSLVSTEFALDPGVIYIYACTWKVRIRGPPFNLQGGGQGFEDGQDIFFTLLQQIHFFPLLGLVIKLFISFWNGPFFLKAIMLFQQLAATNYLFYDLLALNYLFHKYPSPPPSAGD